MHHETARSAKFCSEHKKGAHWAPFFNLEISDRSASRRRSDGPLWAPRQLRRQNHHQKEDYRQQWGQADAHSKRFESRCRIVRRHGLLC